MEAENALYRQVQSIPALMEETYWKLEADARLLLPTPEIFNTQTVYLFGSGDSYNAALGAAQAFAELAGIPAQALPAMQAARYTAPCLQRPAARVLAIGISNSGEAARTVEAVQAFARAGARTLMLTGAPQSRAALAAGTVWQAAASPFAAAPGVRAYAVAQMALYLLAIRFAEVKGRITMDEAGTLRKTVYAYREVYGQTLNKYSATLQRFAALCGSRARAEWLGAGPARASADFAAAKAIEAVGLTATSQDVEEFAHLNFFLNQPQNIPTVLFAPAGARAHSRNVEIAQQLHAMGRPLLIFTTGSGAYSNFEKGVVRFEADIPEYFFPLFASCAAAGLVAHIPLAPGDAYFRGHSGPWAEEGAATIRTSHIEVQEAAEWLQ